MEELYILLKNFLTRQINSDTNFASLHLHRLLAIVGPTRKGLIMDQKEIAKLVTCIEENLRASPSSGLPFVDTRHSRMRLLSKQNHVVFGRRGAGKTTLVSTLKESSDHIDIYLNIEDYKDITFPNIVIHILVEMLTPMSHKKDGKRSANPYGG